MSLASALPGILPGGGGGAPSGSAGDLVTLGVAGAFDRRTPGATGSSLITAATAEAARVILCPAVAYDGGSSTGWTISNGGTNRAASISSNRFNLSITAGELGAAAWVPSADHPRIYRDLSALLTTTREDWSVIARLAVHSAGGRAGIAVGDASDASGCFATVAANGLVSLTGSWGNGADASSGSGALPVDGTGWVILWSRGGDLGVGYGTGTSADPPSRWAPLTGGNAARARGVVSRLTLYAWDATGVGATVAWDDVRVTDGR